MAENRPNPDDLLQAVTRESSKRGRLKVFLGASAGVGKTFAMLTEAQERKSKGDDVVIGFVETHGRKETHALTADLEQVPLLCLEHRGADLVEVNVDAVITRRPGLVLIDELAHTNAPGSRQAKRWQDVDEVLAEGIDVYTAVNIQHLESLNDVVAQVTGVRVNETVPDSFVEQAHEIEVIDIPPADLRQRLKEGKVYIPERIETALDGFFKTSNLTALRELALRKAADTVDAEVRRLKTQEGAIGPWATKDRVVVCVAPNRMASRVVRSAARLASASHAELIAVYVESDRQSARSDREHAAVQEALDLATELGMEVVTLSGHDIVAELIQFAHRRNATLVVVGKPIRPRWRELIFGSVVDELVRASGDVDILVITAAEPAVAKRPLGNQIPSQLTAGGLATVAATILVTTGVGFASLHVFGIANVAMVYLLGVALCAMRITRAESVIAAVASVLSFNFFFVEPRYTFAVSDSRYLVLFAVMLTVAVVISSLTQRLRGQLLAASERERRTQSLYSLSRQLAVGRSKRELAQAAADEIAAVFAGDVAVYLYDAGQLSLLIESRTGFESASNETAVANWVASHASAAGLGTDTLPGAAAHYLPLNGAESTFGVLAFKPDASLPRLAQRHLLETFANSLGLALERAMLAKASNDARVFAESERIRSTLLSSISHDLRTPLTAITGAASSIKEGCPNPGEMAETIYDESIRLNQQIQNLLDMTRLQSGNVQPNLQWHDPGEIVASAVRIVQPMFSKRGLSVSVRQSLPLLFVDGLLVEKALVNLLENAARHTTVSDNVSVQATSNSGSITFEVSDTGPGLDPQDTDTIFQLGAKRDSAGHGLGLAVVKAVAELHGGTVAAANVLPHGARFELTIPLPDRQPETPHA